MERLLEVRRFCLLLLVFLRSLVLIRGNIMVPDSHNNSNSVIPSRHISCPLTFRRVSFLLKCILSSKFFCLSFLAEYPINGLECHIVDADTLFGSAPSNVAILCCMHKWLTQLIEYTREILEGVLVLFYFGHHILYSAIMHCFFAISASSLRILFFISSSHFDSRISHLFTLDLSSYDIKING